MVLTSFGALKQAVSDGFTRLCGLERLAFFAF